MCLGSNQTCCCIVVVIKPKQLAKKQVKLALLMCLGATTPGLICIIEIMNRYVNPLKAFEIRLLDNEIDLLKSLHDAYWSGLRYVKNNEFQNALGGSIIKAFPR